MLPLLLADATADTSSLTSALWIGIVVLGLSNLVGLAISVMTFIRMAGGKDGERQVEPTALHAISSELRTQTDTLNKLDREMGVVTANVGSLEKKIDDNATRQASDTKDMFTRLNAISRESTDTAARVHVLEKKEAAHA